MPCWRSHCIGTFSGLRSYMFLCAYSAGMFWRVLEGEFDLEGVADDVDAVNQFKEVHGDGADWILTTMALLLCR